MKSSQIFLECERFLKRALKDKGRYSKGAVIAFLITGSIGVSVPTMVQAVIPPSLLGLAFEQAGLAPGATYGDTTKKKTETILSKTPAELKLTLGQLYALFYHEPLATKTTYFSGSNAQGELAVNRGYVTYQESNITGGEDTIIRGAGAIALGGNSKAIGVGAIALGQYADSAPKAIGWDNQLRKFVYAPDTHDNVAIGFKSTSKSNFSVALGARSGANEDGSNAIGFNTQATGKSSLAIGYNTFANTKFGPRNNLISTIEGMSSRLNANTLDTFSKLSAEQENKRQLEHDLFTATQKGDTKKVEQLTGAINVSNARIGSYQQALVYSPDYAALVGDANSAAGEQGGDHILAKALREQGGVSKLLDKKLNQAYVADSTHNALNLDVAKDIIQNPNVADNFIENVAKEGDNAIAIGNYTSASGNASVAQGVGAFTKGDASIALGSLAHTTEKAAQSVAIGTGAQAFNKNSLALGTLSSTYGKNNIAVGNRAAVLGDNSSGIGVDTLVLSENSVALGNKSRVEQNANRSIAIGDSSNVEEGAEDSVSLGSTARVGTGAKRAIAIGAQSQTLAQGSVGIGTNVQVDQNSFHTVAMGNGITTHSKNSVAVGQYSTIGSASENAITIGNTSHVQGKDSIAIGTKSKAYGEDNVVMGNGASSGSVAHGAYQMVDRAVVIGKGAHADRDNNVVLGYGSTDYYRGLAPKLKVGVDPYDPTLEPKNLYEYDAHGAVILEEQDGIKVPAYLPKGSRLNDKLKELNDLNRGIVSVGGEEVTSDVDGVKRTIHTLRRITNVAPGALDNDVVTVAQLRDWKSYDAHFLSVDNNRKENGGKNKTDENTKMKAGYAENGIDIEDRSSNYNNDQASGKWAMALGPFAKAIGETAVGVGYGAGAYGNDSISIGSASYTGNANAVAIGTQARTAKTAKDAVSVGFRSNALKEGSVAVGRLATANSSSSVVIGDGAVAKADDNDKATTWNGTWSGNNAVAIGAGALAKRDQDVAIGKSATAKGGDAIAFGSGANTLGENSIAIGSGAKVEDNSTNPSDLKIRANSIAIGRYAYTNQKEAIAMGTNTKVNAKESVAIGTGAEIKNGAAHSVAIGQGVMIKDNASYGTAIGQGSTINNSQGTAIGKGATVSTNDGIALGSGTIASTAAGVRAWDPATNRGNNYQGITNGAAAISGLGAVSVGNGNHTRQITNVAGGTQDTDAVNVAQVKAINLKIAGNTTDTKKADVRLYDQTLTVKGDGTYITTKAENNTISVGLTQATINKINAVANPVHFLATNGSDGTNQVVHGIATSSNYHNEGAVGSNSVAIGGYARSVGNNTVAIGYQAGTGAINSVAIGNNSYASGTSSIAIGDGTSVGINDGVALGSQSVANTNKGVVGWDPAKGRTNTYSPVTAGGIASTSGLGAVSVGAKGKTRQITNVSAGTEDTDAVNVAQLKGLNLKIEGDGKTSGDLVVHRDALKITGESGYVVTSADGNALSVGLTDTVKNTLSNVFTPTFKGDNNGVVTPTKASPQVALVGSAVNEKWGAGAGRFETNNIGTFARDDASHGKQILLGLKSDLKSRSFNTYKYNGDTATDEAGPSISYANIDMNNKPITNLKAGVNGSDAVNKSQLDAITWNLGAKDSSDTIHSVTPSTTNKRVDLVGADGISVTAKGSTVTISGKEIINTIPVVYTDASGNRVYKHTDGKFYTNEHPQTGVDKPVTDVRTRLVDGAGSTTSSMATAPTLSNVGSSINKVPASSGGNATYTDKLKEAAKIAPTGVVNVYDLNMTAKDLKENLGWNVTSDVDGGTRVTDTQATVERVTNDNTVTFKAGKNLAIKQDGKNFTYSLHDEVTDLSKVEVKQGDTTTTITPGKVDAAGVVVGHQSVTPSANGTTPAQGAKETPGNFVTGLD
ncbi:hypothetical protein, partial [Veillonella montpellierensis]|uniref:hypothetical protein n=1 Tax=Veillonella montpellierensis TaxID=187328 RepID=UPI0023F6678E